MVSRRNLLGAVGATGAGAVTLSRFDLWPEVPDFSGPEPPSEAVLCAVDVQNRHEEPHTVEIQVEQNGEIVTETSRDLPAMENRHFPPGFAVSEHLPTELGQFILTVTLDGETTQRFDSADSDDGHYWLYVFVDGPTDIDILAPVNPSTACPPDAP
ncbi:twin-arginine translocation signal domain-containing protein [Haloarchaeobius sp. DFWS5]|uniref:twin-arginine translocation signal domain-containing protein n=1 Tax=Haloarchaeobius sp. DFWS5 TaxID=3446114 RepID=UPI003EBAE86F